MPIDNDNLSEHEPFIGRGHSMATVTDKISSIVLGAGCGGDGCGDSRCRSQG